MINTDNANVSFVLVALCQPVCAAINFSKILQIQTLILLQKFFVTRNFCKKNLSQMHCIRTLVLFSKVLATLTLKWSQNIEGRGNEKFSKVKLLSDFNFREF